MFSKRLPSLYFALGEFLGRSNRNRKWVLSVHMFLVARKARRTWAWDVSNSKSSRMMLLARKIREQGSKQAKAVHPHWKRLKGRGGYSNMYDLCGVACT